MTAEVHALGRRPGGPVWRLGLVFLALSAAVAVPFLLWGGQIEAALDRQLLIEWLAENRASAWLVAILLLVSDILLPIPNTIVMAALGVIYGPLLGGLVATAGTVFSGLAGYGLCRRFGRPLASRLVGPEDLARAERLFHRSGGWMVAASRWLPVLPEAIACMAGLARMPLPTFVVALFCGSAPLGFVIAGLGYAGAERPLVTLILCALLPLPLWFSMRRAGRSIEPSGAAPDR